jgi:hypothetical protein
LCTTGVCTNGQTSQQNASLNTQCVDNGCSFCKENDTCVEYNTLGQRVYAGAFLCCDNECVFDDLNDCGACGTVFPGGAPVGQPGCVCSLSGDESGA